MNERVKDLYVESVSGYFPEREEEVLMSATDLERFAEAIVQECAALCMQEGQNTFNNVWEQIRAKCDAQMILEHFGVEE